MTIRDGLGDYLKLLFYLDYPVHITSLKMVLEKFVLHDCWNFSFIIGINYKSNLASHFSTKSQNATI